MLLNNVFSFCDAPVRWQLGLQDPASTAVEGMIYLHNYLMFYLVFIAGFVIWMLAYVFTTFNVETQNKAYTIERFTHSNLLEIIWTIIPAIVLVFIGIPSFTLLYCLDEWFNPQFNIKIVGHQWYWSYETADNYIGLPRNEFTDFESYMLPLENMQRGHNRLLEVDRRLYMPIKSHIRLLVTAADVLHSWAIPSFGIKIDACPGRLSQGSLYIKRRGIFYGQCSEICGVNHGFMPIVVKAVKQDKYINIILGKMPPKNVVIYRPEDRVVDLSPFTKNTRQRLLSPKVDWQ
jgi:cytochrome c oxidase subunit 2